VLWCSAQKHKLIIVKVTPPNRQELSYRKQLARQLCTQHVEGICNNHVTLKSRLRIIQGHWKRNHSSSSRMRVIYHNWSATKRNHDTTYYKSSYLTLNIIVTLKCGLEVTQGH